MNMYLRELKSHLKSTVIWTLSIIALAVMYLSMYPGIAKDAENFKKIIEGYPKAVQAAVGISVDSISSLLSFYSFVFIYVLLCGAIEAMNLGVSMLTKETREKTCDFLLTKPVSRVSIMNAKLLAAASLILITDVIYIPAAYFLAEAVKTKDFSSKLFLMVSVTLFFVQLMFLSIGVLVSVAVPRLKSVLPVSLGTVFGLYFVGTLLAADSKSPVRFLSPFRYFDSGYIIKNSTYEPKFLIAGAIIVIAAIAASYLVYNRKDIHAV